MDTLKQRLLKISIDTPERIPLIVKLLENPRSPFSLPGNITLYNHDCLHVLLERETDPEGEAFIVGFCMGNDPRTKPIHIAILKFFAKHIYPLPYRFDQRCLQEFDLGFSFGKSFTDFVFCKIDFSELENFSVDYLQKIFAISEANSQFFYHTSHLK